MMIAITEFAVHELHDSLSVTPYAQHILITDAVVLPPAQAYGCNIFWGTSYCANIILCNESLLHDTYVSI